MKEILLKEKEKEDMMEQGRGEQVPRKTDDLVMTISEKAPVSRFQHLRKKKKKNATFSYLFLPYHLSLST